MVRLQGSQDPLGGGVGEGREIHACELGVADVLISGM